MARARRPLLFAHRGTSTMAPENTLAAFGFAAQHAADVLETDVRLSADGRVMVTHDATLERTTDGSGRVREQTLAELQELDAGYRFTQNGAYPWRGQGLQLLTLDELFERFGHLGINIDIKDADTAAAEVVAGVITRHLARHRSGRLPLINVGSFHPPVIEAFRERMTGAAQHTSAASRPDPDHCVSTTAGQVEVARLFFSRWHRHLAPAGIDLPFRFLQIPPRWYGLPLDRPGFIRHAHSRGVSVVYWTINSPAVMAKLLQRGADGIVTDRADLAQALLQPRG